jgi:hypothetical protein
VTIPVLLATCESSWLAPVRMPAALHRAGFEVALLAPSGALAARSRFVARSFVLREHAHAREWLLALAAAVDACRPALVLPGDEMSLRLMQALVLDPPRSLPQDRLHALAQLVVRSLGAPEFYATGTDKSRLQPLLQAAGVRVPEFAVVATAEEAARAARELGPEVVIKPSNGTGSRDVVPCATPQAASDAFLRIASAARRHPATDGVPQVLVQRRIVGRMIGRASVAHDGVELAGFTRERLQSTRALGSSSVVRYLHAAEPADFTRRIARALGITGFFCNEFCVERATGAAYLIDFTRRMAPPTHTGSLVGVDLCAALAAALRGERFESTDLPPDYSHTMALFPQELWRDPESEVLDRYPMDVPWDDPSLLRELLTWRYDAAS